MGVVPARTGGYPAAAGCSVAAAHDRAPRALAA
jgi:hypothetical protein